MKDWNMIINTLGKHISNNQRTIEVDMSMWDTLFPLAKEESCGTHVARYLASYQGEQYELFTDIKGTPIVINKIIQMVKLNKKAKQIEWDDLLNAESQPYSHGNIVGNVVYHIYPEEYDKFGVLWIAEMDYERHCWLVEVAKTRTLEKAKEACQQHLQQYVDSLYNDLQQLTEDL